MGSASADDSRICRAAPYVLRHFCASELYLNGLDLISIQEVLGHSWIATTMRYVHVHRTRVEDAGWPGTNEPLGGWKVWSDEVEPAADRGEPGHLEGIRPATEPGRERLGDLGGENVGAVVRAAGLSQTR